MEGSRLELHISNQRKWQDTLLQIFPQHIPDQKEWKKLGDISNLLNIIGQKENHAFFPNGGGLDVINAQPSIHEAGCLEVNFDGLINILQPAKMTFFKVNGTLLCSYFKVSLITLRPSQVHPNTTECEEVMDKQGDYYSTDRGYAPESGARRITRLLRGDIYIFGKGSPYNTVKFHQPFERFDAYLNGYTRRELPEVEFNQFLDNLSTAYKKEVLK